ncbi:hypothetical protein ABPG75_013606 [Micractinium tetrahymenae]
MQAKGSATGALGPAQQAQAGQEQQQGASSSSACGQQQCEQAGCGGGGGEPLPPAPAGPAPAPGTTCMKCRKQEAQVVARGREPLCYPCLHDQLFAKVRNAVRLHGLIQPGKTAALAFSGGAASAVLLRFLSELRNPRSDRPARGKVSFSLHILHIDESTALGLGPEAAAAARDSVAAAAAQYVGAGSGTSVQYHCIPLEAVFEEEGDRGDTEGQQAGQAEGDAGLLAALASGAASERQRQRLQALLWSVRDPTGRQDLARHLRTHLLLRCAAALDCSRVARGDCATALAAHIVAAASKGCGYSLSGDVQLLDARHGAALPSFFLPLREISVRELRTLCRHWQLPLAEAEVRELAAAAAGGGGEAAPVDKKNINALAAAFIAGMEAHNPGSVPNILNTISKLQAFPWNELPSTPGQQQQRQQQGAVQQREQQQGAPTAAPAAAGTAGAAATEQQLPAGAVLCPICLAPLADDELPGSSALSSSGSGSEHTSGGQGAAAAAAAVGCCLSCYAQILASYPVPGGASGQAPALGGSSASSSRPVVAALPAAVSWQMAALAAAGQSAADAALAEACNGGSSSGSSRAERLRAQIAEFLLE